MSLSIKTRHEDGVTVLELSGRLTIGEPVLSLRDTIRGAVADGGLKFVLNLGQVSYIDRQFVAPGTSVRLNCSEISWRDGISPVRPWNCARNAGTLKNEL